MTYIIPAIQVVATGVCLWLIRYVDEKLSKRQAENVANLSVLIAHNQSLIQDVIKEQKEALTKAQAKVDQIKSANLRAVPCFKCRRTVYKFTACPEGFICDTCKLKA